MPAMACQYEFAPEPVGGPSAQFLARKMGAAATFIDLAMAEGAADVRGPDGKVSPWAKAISFRVIDRWKGQSSDRFILFGGLDGSNGPGWSLSHWVDDKGRIEPWESVREASALPPAGMTSCDPPALMAKAGQTYVVLREADGRLLGAVEFHAGAHARRGTAIAAAPLWPNDDWARQLSYLREPPRTSAIPADAPVAPRHAFVRFRRALDATAVSRLLGQAKAIPFSATLVRNGVSADYRLGSDIAYDGLITDAARWAGARTTNPALLKAHVATLLDTIAVRDLANDSAWMTYARAILALLDAPAEAGLPRFTTVGIVGDDAIWRRLAVLPEVAEVTPARLVRGRIADAFRSQSASLPTVTAIEAHRRLTGIAGQDLPPSAITGRWRMTGGDTLEFGEKVLTLDLREGRAVAAMPCARAEGSYRFAGRVLELTLPKPDLSSCPKNQDHWYPAFLFDTDGVITVRPAGDRLEFVHSGGTFHFRREAM
ncbi:hypothetical protein H9L13_05650 [Sphingomonas lutea]|uniref:Uncharacterized protein n=1 Tax=Sphingomonas lutea TaxID=1045317 RepID=A0A7G9SKH2_9SPHN|nr:hypothetical protein [Sphingomonas lutea]QNN68347.1 hypothetical protein H9L13_05650 [Sphingomonas lutea]